MNDSDHQFELNNWNPELVINKQRILNTTQVEGGGLVVKITPSLWE
jgi:hypothetical protein